MANAETINRLQAQAKDAERQRHAAARRADVAAEAATQPEPRTFTIVRDWDVTEAHGAPDAHTYGMCQSAANLAGCMGSRVSYTEVGDTTWRMERQGESDTWQAVDVTAVRQFDLMGG